METKILSTISVVLQIGGLIIVGLYGNWFLALGVVLCIWGNNISERYLAQLSDSTAYNKVGKN